LGLIDTTAPEETAPPFSPFDTFLLTILPMLEKPGKIDFLALFLWLIWAFWNVFVFFSP